MMKKLVWLALGWVAYAGCSKKPARAGDLVIRHANILTMEDKNPRATALAVKGDKILWVGDDQNAEQYIGAQLGWWMPEGGYCYRDLSTATFT
jgi:hypothetical protein